MQLDRVPYLEAWDLQRSVAAAVSSGELPDTVLLLEHPPVVTLGRRTDPGELHIPSGAAVEIVETDRGGKSTYHGPGQLVCYPIFDLTRHGLDVKKYCRDLEEAVIVTLKSCGLEGARISGLTGIWLERQRRAVRAVARHRVEGVAAGDDSSEQRNLGAFEAVGITRAVEMLVTGADDPTDLAEQAADAMEHPLAFERVRLDYAAFLGRQGPGLVDDLVRD